MLKNSLERVWTWTQVCTMATKSGDWSALISLSRKTNSSNTTWNKTSGATWSGVINELCASLHLHYSPPSTSAPKHQLACLLIIRVHVRLRPVVRGFHHRLSGPFQSFWGIIQPWKLIRITDVASFCERYAGTRPEAGVDGRPWGVKPEHL